MFILEQLEKSEPRLRALGWVVVGGFSLIVAMLWYLQVLSYKKFTYEQISQSSRSVRIPAVRGKILDSQGNVLVETKPGFNLCLYIEELSPLFKSVYATVITNEATRIQKQLGRKLNAEERQLIASKVRYLVASNSAYRAGLIIGKEIRLDEETFEKSYKERLAIPMRIYSDLTPTQLALIHEAPSIPPGIDIEVQPIRYYPYKTLASHVIGHLSRDDKPVQGEDAFFNYLMPDYKGVIGIEGVFDEYLRGKAGYKSVMVNYLGYKQSESVWEEAEPGKNVVLTIDKEIQEIAEKALKSEFPTIKGAVVVMNPNNGDILALVSSPSFDPNVFIPKLSQEDASFLNNPELRPMVNRASQERYPPGSVFKIITALACLEAGIDPTEKYLVQPDPTNPSHGCVFVGNRKIKDTAPPGEYDLRRALVRSSNSYFVHYGLRVGVSKIISMGKRFCLGEPINLPTGQSDRGFFPTEAWIREQTRKGNPWTDGDTANLSIGQGYISVNPVQIATLISAVANGGKLYFPRLVQRVDAHDEIHNFERIEYPVKLRTSLNIPQHHLEFVKKAMLDDVEDPEGTGRLAVVTGLKIAGKTGTAEVQEGNVTVDKITWFASFAPFESPRYVVVVMVESGVSGGRTCAPIAAQIYRGLMGLERMRRLKFEQVAVTEKQD